MCLFLYIYSIYIDHGYLLLFCVLERNCEFRSSLMYKLPFWRPTANPAIFLMQADVMHMAFFYDDGQIYTCCLH